MKHLIEIWKTWSDSNHQHPVTCSDEELTAGFFLSVYDSPGDAMDAVYRHRMLADGFYLRVWGILASLQVPQTEKTQEDSQ